MERHVTEHAWMALRTIGAPGPTRPVHDVRIVEQLVEAALVEIRDGHPVITDAGRRVIVRGSPSRWTGAF